MKHIVILGTAYPFRGGLAAFNERLAEELIRMGHRVDLVTFTVQYPTFLFPGKSQMSDDPKPSLNIFRWLHAFNPFNWIQTGLKLRRLKPDLIICKFWLPLMGPALATVIRIAKTKNALAVSILDNVVPHEKRPGDKLFTRYFLNCIDRFIYMSEQVGRDLDAFHTGKPNQLIPHPIYDNYGQAVSKEEAVSHLKLDPDCQYVLFFGFIREYKGLDLLLDAIALLPPVLGKLRFIIAGEFYTDSAPYLARIEELGIREKLILHTRFISNEEVRYYFCAADLVVQPYKSATQSGIAQIAIHFNRPTIVTRVGGLHEIIEDGRTGFVVGVDPKEIVEAMVAFFSMTDHSAFTAALEETKKKYSWEKMALAALEE